MYSKFYQNGRGFVDDKNFGVFPVHSVVCTIIAHLCPRWNWKKTAGNRCTCFGVRMSRILDYSTINLNPRNAPNNHNVLPSQTDRQTGEHHGNSAMIRSN